MAIPNNVIIIVTSDAIQSQLQNLPKWTDFYQFLIKLLQINDVINKSTSSAVSITQKRQVSYLIEADRLLFYCWDKLGS